MKAKAYRLLVVAHPDDETIFFGGLLMRKRSVPWKVICVTDGNADGRGKERALEFQAATKLLGAAKAEQWNFPDRFPRDCPSIRSKQGSRNWPRRRKSTRMGP